MVATMNYRGYLIWWDGTDWRYELNDEIALFKEPAICPKCMMPVSPEGHDQCIRNLPNVKAACCGHGIKDGYVMKEGD